MTDKPNEDDSSYRDEDQRQTNLSILTFDMSMSVGGKKENKKTTSKDLFLRLTMSFDNDENKRKSFSSSSNRLSLTVRRLRFEDHLGMTSIDLHNRPEGNDRRATLVCCSSNVIKFREKCASNAISSVEIDTSNARFFFLCSTLTSLNIDSRLKSSIY